MMDIAAQAEPLAKSVHYSLQTKTVLDFINMHVSGQLNLSPGFQRESVWKEPQRAALIDSMLKGYPIPAIFLCVHHANGKPTYDVIDGKQRLESILKFCGKIRGGFSTKAQLFSDGEIRDVNWKLLEKSQLRHLIEQFQLSVVQVEGELGDVINLFVRINSTGSALTMQERRRAKFFKSPILDKAQELAQKLESTFKSRGILNQSQITRMKHVELVCELMLSAAQGGAVLNKKSALDRVLTTGSLDAKQLRLATASVSRCVKLITTILPGIKTTRFRKLSDFYSLCCLFMKFETEHLILVD